VSVSGRETRISLRVQPNATRNEVVGFAGGVLRVKIAAPPVKGKANRELIVFLSQLLGVSKGALTILQGHTSPSKIIAIAGLNQEEVIKRIFPVKPG
jgi:uncharacterized protein (TIGR00251 family)